MTSPRIDHQAEAHRPDAADAAGLGPASSDSDASAIDSRPGPAGLAHIAAATTRSVRGVEAVARTGASVARRGANGLAALAPGTLKATRTGAHWAIGALQALPDETLRSLAATSVGLGAGLSFTRAGRLAFIAGMVPAAIAGAAIVVRPVASTTPAGAGG